VCLLLAVPGLAALAQAPAPAPVAKPAVATVGTRRILREEYDRRLAVVEQQAAARGGERPPEFKDLLRRQMLETLIRLNLLVLEAKRTGLTVSGAEAESALQRDPFFSPNGQFDPQRWQLTRASQPAKFQSALIEMSDQLAARRLDERLQARFRPPDDVLRSKAVRQLRRAVTEDLSLRSSEFSGNYPEPREGEVLAYYRAHPEEWRRPERAALSVVFVNVPPMTQLERSEPSAGEAWEARMRQAADSLLVAVRGGARLEDVSMKFGGPRSDVTVIPDNFPGYWKGSAAQSAAVFKTAPGALLAEPVRGSDGYLVVRVDETQPVHIAPLASVAREVRGKLREDSRLHHDERDRRALFETLRDSLAGPAWTFRWAAVDTGTVKFPEPTEADLDRWYRGHLADFSSFDPATGSIVARTLPQVHDEVRVRCRRDKRIETARLQADELYQTWSAGRRSAALEGAVRARETQPTPMGGEVDTGFAAAALSDTVWQRGEPHGAGLAPFARGYLVWQVVARVPRHTPTFEQAEPALRAALELNRRAAEEAGARRLFDADPKRFGGGRVVHFTRMVVSQPDLSSIKLTRAEVERWHRSHMDKYSAPELVRARHVLISPINDTPAADRAARVRADSLLARIRAGESFDDIAARFSDDPATKDKGGDLGVFARGTMLEPFENAVFAMKEGELGGPVKTEVGYHIIECTEHVQPYVQPLKLVYGIVASDLARTRADTVAMLRADSLLRFVKSAAQGRVAAARLGLVMLTYEQGVDERQANDQLVPYFTKLFTMKPGEVMPTRWLSRGEGYWITWVDSISPGGQPMWEDARTRAVAAYREGAGERAVRAKVTELDSMASAGWSFDSLATLWGGVSRSRELSAAGVGDKTSISPSLDSLVFGSETRPPALAPGQVSGWVRWPGGLARVRLAERQEPPPDRVQARVDELRRIVVERQMSAYFEDVKKRFPVRILDRSLAAIPLPAPPEE
jgi:parvulin-like peptidyl-prolyl isomerase